MRKQIAQVAKAAYLSEGHIEELIQAGEGAYATVAAVALDAAMQGVERQVVHELSKDELSGTHLFSVPARRLGTAKNDSSRGVLESFTSGNLPYIIEIQDVMRSLSTVNRTAVAQHLRFLLDHIDQPLIYALRTVARYYPLGPRYR